jgi:hypothetical protein
LDASQQEYLLMIVVRRTYVPRAGEGGKMLALIKEAGQAMKAAGFEKPRVLRGWHGDHGVIYTEQKWASIQAYEDSREKVRKTPGITTVFEKIYPTLAQTHHTEILEELES